MVYLELTAGLVYLLGGGDLLVRGSVALARRTGVPDVVVALAVVAFGTSLPELVVSVRASVSGHPGLILGNVVGSNIANVLLVAGVAAAMQPLVMDEQGARTTGSVMLAGSLLFAALCVSGDVSPVEGWLLVSGFAVSLVVTGLVVVRAPQAPPTTPLDWALGIPSKLHWIVIFIVVGTAVLPLGADRLIESAVQIAGRLGVSETVVGLSLVAIGTSLPEVATAVLAVLQGRSGVALGTIIGSNIFNLLAIMGVAAVIAPVPVSGRFLSFDLPVMIATSLLLVALAWIGGPLGRRGGVAFLVAYLAYLAGLFASV